jgi:hypothetical protein
MNIHPAPNLASFLLRLWIMKISEIGQTDENEITDVQSAYKNPQKHQAAMNISAINCIIIARSERTMRLSFSVTKANLKAS